MSDTVEVVDEKDVKMISIPKSDLEALVDKLDVLSSASSTSLQILTQVLQIVEPLQIISTAIEGMLSNPDMLPLPFRQMLGFTS